MAIIGGGISGVATAYLCDAGWSIDLFEAESRLGGNAATVDVDGMPVDLGAETFNPATHPLYWSLLAQIGADDSIIELPGTLSVFDAATRMPRFVSRHPLRTPRHAIGLLRFISAARRFLASDPSPDLTLDEWFAQQSFDRGFAQEVLLPWLASLTSSRIETLKTQSMRAFLVLFAPAFPTNLLASPKTYGSRIGLGGIVEKLAEKCRGLTVHTDARVRRVEQTGGSWFVETPAGRSGPYEKVVVTAPPYAAREVLAGIPDALAGILNRYDYYPARLVIHDDPTVMPADRRDWCMHNAAVDGDTCEATFWLGAYRTDPVSGEPVQLFKSWATHRTIAPEAIRAERTFHHLLLTPDAVRAAADLAPWQGRDGLFFAGHATQLTDLQETALASAMAVAEVLDPDSTTLSELRRRARASVA
jgi:predicted NAD/FAD-binding protein